MNLLAFDTCFAACSVAARVRLGDDERRAVRFEAMTTGHAERLFPMIDGILAELEIGYADLDGLAVTVGPGSFTGTRLGIAAARGLALATGLSVFGTTSLAAIAARAVRTSAWPDDPVLVCHDARRGQIYAQCFGDGAAASGLSAPVVLGAEELLAALRPGNYVVTGTAAAIVDAAARESRQDRIDFRVHQLPGDGLPDAEALLDLPLETLSLPSPLYLRPPDAKPQAGHSIPRAQ